MSTSGGRDAESFYEKMNDYLFIQHVKFNTRHRINNVSSRLDLIFTNEEEMIGRLTCARQYFGTLIFELFFEIIRPYVNKINFSFLC